MRSRASGSQVVYRLILSSRQCVWAACPYPGGPGADDRMSRTNRLLAAFAATALLPSFALAETIGIASWYGAKHDGLRTSSGQVFDQEGMTAASRSIPLGSRVRVTMTETGQSVMVLVNDRMGGRSAIIDLSKGAAREIGLLGRGRAMVSIASAAGEPVEVAEASEDDAADVATDEPHGRRHRHHAGRSVSAGRPCCRVPSVILARHSVQPRATRHRL